MRNRLIPCLLLFAATAAPALAQDVSAGATFGPWLMDGGTASNDATVRPGFAGFLRVELPVIAPVASFSWAPEADFDPGLTLLTVGVRPRLVGGDDAALFADLGVGVAHIAADNQAEELRDCTPEAGCMFEGVSYRTGWGGATTAGLGLDLRLFGPMRLEVSSALALRFADDKRLFARYAMGLAWRR